LFYFSAIEDYGAWLAPQASGCMNLKNAIFDKNFSIILLKYFFVFHSEAPVSSLVNSLLPLGEVKNISLMAILLF
jgi:hypothetical protein